MADARKTMRSWRDMRLLLLCWSGLIVARLALLLISYLLPGGAQSDLADLALAGWGA